MDGFTFKNEWMNLLMMLGLGDTEDLFDAIIAVKDYVLYGEEPTDEALDKISYQAAYAATTIISGIKEEAVSEAKKRDGKIRGGLSRGKQKQAEVSRSKQKLAEEKEEEREEDGEAERENDKEEIPHTPLEEKDKEKGEEGEEEKEEEREIISRPLRAEVCEIALPEPQFIAETDPKKLTERMLEEEFDALWLLYPRKDGRKDALRHYKAARREGVTFDEVESGIKRYANYVRDKDPTYTAMGSTWFCGHRWEDRIENHGPRPGSMAWLANIANGGALDDS